MKKNFLKAIFCTALAAPLFTACELDQMPPNYLPSEKTWQNVEQLNRHYLGLQGRIRSVSGGSMSYMTDLQADLFNAVTGATGFTNLHNWTFTSTQFDGDAIWSGNYALVNEANDILGHIAPFLPAEEEMPETNQALFNAASAAHIKAASHFAIAYAYSNMIVRYCEDYEPETAAQKLGLPIVTKVDVDARPARATLEETVKFIYQNIEEAKKYFNLQEVYLGALKDDPATPGKNEITTTMRNWNYGNIYNPSIQSTYALESRVDLYSHNFANAIQNSSDLIEAGYSLSQGSGLQALWIYDGNNQAQYMTEIILMPLQTPDERTASYGLFASLYFEYDDVNQQYNLQGFSPSYIPTKGLIDLYEDNDTRKQLFFHDNVLTGVDLPIYSTSNSAYGNGLAFWKFPGNPNLLKSDSEFGGVFCNMAKPFRIAEQYLIIAEAALRQDARNEGLARTYLNDLRQSRGASAVPETTTGTALDQLVEDEWTREFVGEGFRLDVLKRLHKGFTRMKPQLFDQPVLNDGQDYQNLRVEANDIRFIWEIPQQDRQTNKNLEANWPENKKK